MSESLPVPIKELVQQVSKSLVVDPQNPDKPFIKHPEDLLRDVILLTRFESASDPVLWQAGVRRLFQRIAEADSNQCIKPLIRSRVEQGGDTADYEMLAEMLGMPPVPKPIALVPQLLNTNPADQRKRFTRRALLGTAAVLAAGINLGLTALTKATPDSSETATPVLAKAAEPTTKPVAAIPATPTVPEQEAHAVVAARGEPSPTVFPTASPTARPTFPPNPTVLPSPTATAEATPILSKEARIIYPTHELNDYKKEIIPWLEALKTGDFWDPILCETACLSKDLAELNPQLRNKVFEAMADGIVEGLVKSYGLDKEMYIALDPGHGGTDIGAGAKLNEGGEVGEKNVTWPFAQKVADKIYEKSKGKYLVIFVRPHEPQDFDLDRDGIISNVERIQKRMVLFLQEIKKRKGNQPGWNQDNVYLSFHFDGASQEAVQRGAPDSGVRILYPNNTPYNFCSQDHRDSAAKAAQVIQKEIVGKVRAAGYNIPDLGATADPYTTKPGSNSDNHLGPYLILFSEKVLRKLIPE